MKKVQVCLEKNGIESAIEIIEVEDDYTTEDYVEDCYSNDYPEGYFDEYEVIFYELED